MNSRFSKIAPFLSSPRLILPVIAIVDSAVYLAQITFRIPITTYYLMPHLDIPKIMGVSAESLQWFAGTMAVLVLLYGAAAVTSARLEHDRSAAGIIVLAAAIGLTLVPMFPGAAGDVYAYIAEADMVLKYHLNPFVVPVSSVPDHPILPFLDYPAETTHYGPLWLAISVLLRLLSGGDLLFALLIFKLAALALLVVMAWLVYASLKERDSAWAIPATVLVAWNPLLLFETAGNAHNDVAMMALVALAFFLDSRGAKRGAILSLIAACLVKYVAVVLLPIFLVSYLRRSPDLRSWLPRIARDTLVLFTLGIGLVMVVGTEGTVGVLDKMTTWFTTSPGAVAYYWLQASGGQRQATEVVKDSTRLAFCLLYLLPLGWVVIKPSALGFSALTAVIGFLLIVTVWFQPWYVIWALPLAALAASPLGACLAFGLTVGGLAVHIAMGFAWRLWWLQDSMLDVMVRGAASMWLPVLVCGIAGLAVTIKTRSGGSERREPARETAALTNSGASTTIAMQPDQHSG